jgi:signal transduction histidine kinase
VLITILGTAAAADPASLQLVYDVAAEHSVDVRHASEQELVSEIVSAQARGAVVVVVAGDLHATRVLGLGADEVVRVSEMTRISLAAAIERAGIRGEAREKKAREVALHRDDAWATFSLLVSALGHQLGSPLSSAKANCELLCGEISSLLDAFSDLSEWATLALPLQQLRHLAKRRAGAMSFEEIRSALSDLQESLQRIVALANDLRAFARTGTGDGVQVGAVARELEAFLREHLAERIDFALELGDTHPVALARPTIVCMLGALLSQAVIMAQDSGRPHPKVRVRTVERDDVLEVEIEHDGLELSATDLLGIPSRSSVGLAGVRRRATEAAGELLVDTDGHSTRYRLLLPLTRLDGITSDPPSSGRTRDKSAS